MGTEEQNVLYAFRNEKEKEQQLRDLIKRYWDDWTNYWNNKSKCKDTPDTDPYVVYPAIPIIWFGDINKYWTSPLKIVTVAINPSKNEFSEDGNAPYSVDVRFKDAKILVLESKTVDEDVLIKAYNNYFINDTYYKEYFCKFDHVFRKIKLPGIAKKVSYGNKPECPCTAIHIDFETAIATKYFWGDDRKKEWAKIFKDEKSVEEFRKVKAFLSKKKKCELGFNDLFKDLLDVLQPNIIIFSAASLRDILADKVVRGEGERLCAENFYKPKIVGKAKNKVGDCRDYYYRVSYKIDGKLWIYGTNNNRTGPFFLPKK